MLRSLDIISGCWVGGAGEVESVSRVKRRTRAKAVAFS